MSGGTAGGATAPNSAGAGPPRAVAPEGACDAHCHVLDPRFPTPEARELEGMSVDDYVLLQRRVGLTRAVFVQAKYHRTDNSCTLDAVRRLGANGRGIAVVGADVTDAELRSLHVGGVRGLRFSVWNPADTVTTINMIEPLSKRIADLGWHAQIHMSGDQIVETAAMLDRLPCPIVFDHMGRLPPQRGPGHPAFQVIARVVDAGKAWVKLAGAYLNTEQGPPEYADATRIARAFVKAAPERLVWGSDWPHVTEEHKPDDAALFDLLTVWAGDKKTRERILVQNPAKLYGFA
jgi:D-galactarolactone isomerase